MNKIEKISLSRIVSDLIKADSVIDCREMDLFTSIKATYNLNDECLCEARYITFADAVNNLSNLEKRTKTELLNLFKQITLADGMCNKDEALLMIALLYCFEEKYETEMLHVHVPQQGLQLDNSQVIYIETEYDESINGVLDSNFHQIENAMRLAGFEFAYIPQIANTYKTTSLRLFNDVMKFLTPNLNNDELGLVKKQVSSMTTAQFCKEQFCKKLHINSLLDTYPSFLIKVGETITESNIYANFLKVVIEDNVMSEIKQFIFLFTSMMNAEYSIIKNVYNNDERFVYNGVYKQIIDLCLMKENTMSRILLDTFKQKILLPEINEELKVTRSERALYVLILLESLTGGLNVNEPINKKQLLRHKAMSERIMKKFGRIYTFFGGDIKNLPNIMDSTIRNPKISKINKKISLLGTKLSSVDDYMVKRTSEGLYRIEIDSNMLFSSDASQLPLMQSEFWREVISI